MNDNNKKLLSKLLTAANYIQKHNIKPKANNVIVNKEFIKEQADKLGITYDEMIMMFKDLKHE